MIAEFSALMGAVKAMMEIIKTSQDSSKEVKFNEVAIPLQGHIIDLQMKVAEANLKYESLIERNKELREEIAKHDEWVAIAEKYEHKVLDSDMHLYGLKKEHLSKEPFHWICPNCFADKKKTILQPDGANSHHLKCRCGFTATTKRYEAHPTIAVFPRRRHHDYGL